MKSDRIHAGLVAVSAVAGVLQASPARADPSLADKSMATQLFKEGRALLDQGHIAQACRKLEESQRLEPGGGTLLNLALCHEKEGRSATAWVEFTEALGIAKHDDRPQRVEFARSHLSQLEPLLSRLLIQVPPAADSPDLEIKRDGSVVGRAAWASPIPVDPGDHVVEASAPGKVTWKQEVVVAAKGDLRTVVVPQLENAPPAADEPVSVVHSVPAHGATVDESTQAPARLPVRTPERPSGGLSAVPAWISLGVGVVGIGVGTYFGLRALSQKNDADAQCRNDLCSPSGTQLTNEAIGSANISTVGFGVGAAGLAAGTILLLLHGGSAQPQSAASLRLGGFASDSGGAMTVGGAW